MKHTIQYPEGNVLLRNLSKNYPIISHGKDVYLFDQSGKKYFDASGGALVCNLGHGNEELAHAVYEQMRKVAYVNGMQFTSSVMEEAASLLAAKAAPLGLNKVLLLASGSEAVEAAIKFARQLWVDRGFPDKYKLISRTPGYHGNTLYALSASGRPHYKKLYGPLISPVLSVTTPYGYRSPVVNSSVPEEILREYHALGAEYYARELEDLIAKEGAGSISAFIFETVSGSSTGAWVPPLAYFERITAICKKNNILLIADEVMCGAGRTGRFFAAEHFDLKPDIAVLGKGINAGLMPVAAVLVKESDVDTMKKTSGAYVHAQTYMQSPSMGATALAVLKYFDRHQVLAHAARVTPSWLNALQTEIAPLSMVGSVTGIGSMAGVEFVEDKSTKKPFPIAKKIAQRFVAHAQDQGLIVWPNYGQADGTNGDLIILGPSLQMTESQAQECVALLKHSIETFQR
ncbi:MAG: aminotransferase class III-fold pyridoxal phosphate-dependent enzyme [Bdellovibrionales bacterium]|nr:aminotransferase class III-fold pyridoxal phosphate-dependent enzyme [Oligoflexia bacterium]